MKRRAVLALVLLLLAGCYVSPGENADRDSFTEFIFDHYSSGGTAEQYPAIILFEQNVATFTSYQVAFVSCTCRDALTNYYSVCYVELLNNKPEAGQSAIRAISFGDNMGLYGDSNPNYYRHDYTQEYMDEHFIQRLVRTTKDEFDAWEGYGSQLAAVDVDAVTGATVTTSNVISMLKSLFEYHAQKYYS